MHSLLESYLAEVAAHLSPLPPKRRAEELREMRAHLENAVIIHREWGQTEDEAAQNAVAEFGPPRDLGVETVTAWRRGEALARKSFFGAAISATIGLNTLPHLTFLVPGTIPGVITFMGWMERVHPWFNAVRLPFGFLTLDLPAWLLIGTVSGRLFPKRAVAGTGAAMGAWIVWRITYTLWWEYAGLTEFMKHAYLTHRSDYASFGYSLSCLGFDALLALAAVAAARRGSRWRTHRGQGARLARG